MSTPRLHSLLFTPCPGPSCRTSLKPLTPLFHRLVSPIFGCLFLRWNNGQIICTYCISFIYSLFIHWCHLDCFYFPAIVNSASKNISVQISVWVHAFSLFEYIFRSGITDNMVILCLAFWKTVEVFPSVVASFHIPTGNIWVFQFLHILANICYSLFWIKAILVGMKWYLHVILICTSLLTNDAH